MTPQEDTTQKTSVLEEAIKKKDSRAIERYQRLLALAILKKKEQKRNNPYR